MQAAIVIDSRLVMITGGTRGIGYACADVLLHAGYRVHIIAREATDLTRAADTLPYPHRVSWSSLDLASRDEIQAFAAQWREPLWGLINNAGRWHEEWIDDGTITTWDAIMRLNLDAVYDLTRQLLSHVVNGGRIVNMSSQLGTRGRAGFGAYAASKHAVIGLTRCWALELGARAITVNAVCPGWVGTESNSRELGAAGIETVSAELPLERFVEPDEVAALVGFLVSNEGSRITGEAYEIK